jgi:hypothetical protein
MDSVLVTIEQTAARCALTVMMAGGEESRFLAL